MFYKSYSSFLSGKTFSSNGLLIIKIPINADTICMMSYLFIFSLRKKNAKTAVHIGYVNTIQLAVETGIYLTA